MTVRQILRDWYISSPAHRLEAYVDMTPHPDHRRLAIAFRYAFLSLCILLAPFLALYFLFKRIRPLLSRIPDRRETPSVV